MVQENIKKTMFTLLAHIRHTSLIITLKPINLTQILSMFVNCDNIFISNTKLSLV